ncbi:anti-sigma factor family protein [Streptomyces sp. NPDC021224]|uniref:anti-sigma factor family protein n=1 Tax=unclassified Streptomyces TaxID=2593676 RepID=UPI0037969486
MTSRTDQNAHPDVVEIADLAEGILPVERASEVRAHINSCADCADVLASLQEVSGLLAELPVPEAPEPMPADVAARIDAALAAEPLPTSEHADVPRETPRPGPGAIRPAVPRGTSAPAGRPSASTRPSAPIGSGRASQRGRRLLLTAAGAAAVLMLGGLTYELASHSGSGGMQKDSVSSAKGSSGDDAAPDTVAIDVARLLSSPGSSSMGGPAKSPMLGESGDTVVAAPNGTVTSVPSCVLKATQRTDKPLAAERKLYEGVESFVVILPGTDSSTVEAYVLTASCTAETPARVLFESSYPRG